MAAISDNDKCFCNSNKEYLNCCKPLIEKHDFLELIKISDDYLEKSEFALSMQFLLSSYTSYLIKVKSHTEKLNFPNEDMKNFLVDVDVNALAEILDKIIFLFMNSNILFNFPEFLKKSRKDFYNKKWHDKIDFFMVLWYYICKEDTETAIKYIDDNIVIDEVSDVKFIDVLTDVYSKKLSTLQKIIFFDTLISNSASELKKSNYIMRKAFLYFSLYDIDSFNELIKESVDLCDKYYNEKISIIDKYNCAKVYALYGKQNQAYLYKSIKIYEEFLQNDYFKSKDTIFRHIADNYFDLKKYDEAIINFKIANEIQPKDEILIELSRAYIRIENYDKGEESLLEIDFNNLCNELKMDYLTAYSELCCFKSTNKIDFIINEFKKLKPISNYYSEYIQKNIIMLYEIKSSNKTPKKKKKLWKKLNKIIMLKPNFFGLGIDINEAVNLVDKDDK